MPRFVILRHETPPGYPRPAHYDLMFEQAGALWTWAAENLPKPGGDAVAAERLADHRLDYLDYEGEVAGNRGQVARIDNGSYDLVSSTAEEIVLRLKGQSLGGLLTLKPTAEAGSEWQVRMEA